MCHPRRALFPPKRKAVHAWTLSPGAVGKGAGEHLSCSPSSDTSTRAAPLVCVWRCVPSLGAISPGASATQASAATLTWVLRSALVAGARVCGVTLPGPPISSPKSLDGARSPCTRCAPPLGTMGMACLVGQLRVTRPETAAIYPAVSWRCARRARGGHRVPPAARSLPPQMKSGQRLDAFSWRRAKICRFKTSPDHFPLKNKI